jgi:hypothetical protein
MLTALFRLPIGAWAGLVQDGRWGFRTRSAPGWLLDHATVVGARALGVATLVWLVATFVARWPDDWHVRAVLLVTVVGPLVLLLHPARRPPAPAPDRRRCMEGPHRDAVEAVVATQRRSTPRCSSVRRASRTTRRNAVATGLGPTARVVVHDTLLELVAAGRSRRSPRTRSRTSSGATRSARRSPRSPRSRSSRSSGHRSPACIRGPSGPAARSRPPTAILLALDALRRRSLSGRHTDGRAPHRCALRRAR